MRIVVPDADFLFKRLDKPQISEGAVAAFRAQIEKRRSDSVEGTDSSLPFEYRPEALFSFSPARLPLPMRYANLVVSRIGENYWAMVRIIVNKWKKGGREFEGFSEFLEESLPDGGDMGWTFIDGQGIGYVYHRPNPLPFASIDGARSDNIYLRDISIGFRGAEERQFGSQNHFEDDLLRLGKITQNYVNSYLSFCARGNRKFTNPKDLTVLLPHI